MALQLPPDFAEFLNLLTKHKVRYLLIGGYAVGIYGYVRATNDIDFWIDPTLENAEKAVGAIREFGFGQDELSPEFLLRPGKVTRMGVPPIRIEILNRISGVEFDEAYESRQDFTIERLIVPVIGLADLIRNKESAARPKDLVDAQQLR